MSRWIDADETIIAVVKAMTYGDALRAVREQPTIDIVRCGECKQWNSDGGAIMICTVTDLPKAEDDFCSWGERRDNETD